MAEKIADGLKSIGEKINGQLTELYSQVGDMRVKIAVLAVKMGIMGATAGMVGDAVIAENISRTLLRAGVTVTLCPGEFAGMG